jgi:hypothetical protein
MMMTSNLQQFFFGGEFFGEIFYCKFPLWKAKKNISIYLRNFFKNFEKILSHLDLRDIFQTCSQLMLNPFLE